jgi:hypothetical protein
MWLNTSTNRALKGGECATQEKSNVGCLFFDVKVAGPAQIWGLPERRPFRSKSLPSNIDRMLGLMDRQAVPSTSITKEDVLVDLASTCGRAGPLAAHAIAVLLGHTNAAGVHDRVRSPGFFACLCLGSTDRLELERVVGLVRRTRTPALQRGRYRINYANNKPDDPAAHGHVPLFGFVASA